MSSTLTGVATGAASGAAAGTMVEPGWGTAIGAVVGGVSGLLGGLGQDGQESAAAKANKRAQANAQSQSLFSLFNAALEQNANEVQTRMAGKQYDYNEKAAMTAAELDAQLINAEEQQVDEKYALDTFERIRQGFRERAKIAAGAASAGVYGNTAAVLEANSAFQQGYDTALTEESRSNTIDQLQANKEKVFAELEGRLMDVVFGRNNLAMGSLQSGFRNSSAMLNATYLPSSVEKYQLPNAFTSSLKIASGAASTTLSVMGDLSKFSTKWGNKGGGTTG